MRKDSQTLALLLTLAAAVPAGAAAPNSLIINEANTVSGASYLGGGRFDPTLGRLQGNGQNWLEFLAINADPGKNTVDLRGWKMDWEYFKQADAFGSGTITFSNNAVWAAVPKGSMITVNEWKEAYYLTNTPPFPDNPNGDPVGVGGLERVGGINGLGNLRNQAYDPMIHTKKDFSSNTVWNPVAQSGADWRIHVWAGDKDAQNNLKYFSFTGTVTEPDGTNTNQTPDGLPDVFQIGVDNEAGNFAVNNDDWRITIRDAQNNVIQGPIGERLPGWTGGGINSAELLKLEAFEASTNPTVASYQGVTIAQYQDGSSGTYAVENAWNNYTNVQTFAPLRAWFNDIRPGDVNLDGIVNLVDVQVVGGGWLTAGGLLQGDANGDGIVNLVDVQVVGGHWQETGGAPSPATAVPEPAALVLAGSALVLLAGGLRRRRDS